MDMLDYLNQLGRPEPREEGDFPLLKIGEHLCEIDTIATKKTKAGDEMVAATYKVIEGTDKGRLYFCNFNTKHPNPDVALRGRQDLWKLHDLMFTSVSLTPFSQWAGHRFILKVDKHVQKKEAGEPVYENGLPVMKEQVSYKKVPTAPLSNMQQSLPFGVVTPPPSSAAPAGFGPPSTTGLPSMTPPPTTGGTEDFPWTAGGASQ